MVNFSTLNLTHFNTLKVSKSPKNLSESFFDQTEPQHKIKSTPSSSFTQKIRILLI